MKKSGWLVNQDNKEVVIVDTYRQALNVIATHEMRDREHNEIHTYSIKVSN